MSRHRLQPARGLRLGRTAAAGVSLAVTLVAVLGGLGVLPTQSASRDGDRVPPSSTEALASSDTDVPADASGAGVETPSQSRSQTDRSVTGALEDLPAGSGAGRRVVFSKSAQRVWLVDADESVRSTYLVSGSVTDNLRPRTYAVYSRARWAVGIEDSGVMEYFVRFAHGPNAAIGFHSIPRKKGRPLQTVAQLGTPQSHGCIRQRRADAERMWEFADVGTAVVVTA